MVMSGGQRGIGLNEASLVILDGLDHSGLGLGGLGTIDEGQTTLGSERDTHVDARDGCMMAETMGMFRVIAGFSPRLKRVSGVLRETLLGMHCEDE